MRHIFTRSSLKEFSLFYNKIYGFFDAESCSGGQRKELVPGGG